MKKIQLSILFSVALFFTSCEKKSENVVSNDSNIENTENSANQSSDKSGRSLSESGGNLTAQSGNLTSTTSDLHNEINLSADYLFDFDKALLKPEADKELSDAAKIINEKGGQTIAVTGYTDAKGSEDYNQQLSLQRAQAVKAWFEVHGVKKNIVTLGKGAENPVAPNLTSDGKDDPEGRAKNRRVVIKLNYDQNVSR